MSDEREFEQFLERCIAGLGHQVSGDSAPFLEVWSHTDGVAILGAVGSHAEGWNDVRSHLLGASQRLDWRSLSVERLLTVLADDIALTVMLEHMARDRQEPRTRTLRATQAYRREHGEWRLIHRHANLVTAEDEQHEVELLVPVAPSRQEDP
jgi:ketosteroid isomerase-like protein